MRLSRMLGVTMLVASVTMGACAPAFYQPEVTLTGLRLGGIGLRGGLVYADVAVRNPNRFTLRADRITYDLRVQDPSDSAKWLPFTAGIYDHDVRVASGQTTELQLPIRFDFATATVAMQSIMNEGSLNYSVAGKVNVTEPITRTVPYAHKGVVSLAGAR